MPDFVDDKSPICIPFILDQLKAHQSRHEGQQAPPFFIGLNGIQGAGKTTLVSALHAALTGPPHSLSTAVFSIDDLYLPHAAQAQLARSHPRNPLVQHRGQPSTHDLALGLELFQKLKARSADVKVPSYDKSAFDGAGDRCEEESWEVMNKAGEGHVEVVLFEGWCVGFRALEGDAVVEAWSGAKEREERGEGTGRLGKCRLQDVEFVNTALRGYDVLTNFLDTMIHIDAEDPQYVYGWRQEQEEKLRADKGFGMTDEQVKDFVDGYYPAYELFTEGLRKGVFPNEHGRQLRLIVGKDRKVKHSEVI